MNRDLRVCSFCLRRVFRHNSPVPWAGARNSSVHFRNARAKRLRTRPHQRCLHSLLTVFQTEVATTLDLVLPRKVKQGVCEKGFAMPGRGGANVPVFFKFVPCALQFHALVGCELPVDPMIGGGKSLVVVAPLDLQCSFQFVAAWTSHLALPTISRKLRKGSYRDSALCHGSDWSSGGRDRKPGARAIPGILRHVYGKDWTTFASRRGVEKWRRIPPERRRCNYCRNIRASNL
jgi:hypothetical protein